MVEMPVAVDQHEVPDAGLGQVVPHEPGLVGIGEAVVDEGLITLVDHIGRDPDVQCPGVGPGPARPGLRRCRRAAIVEGQQMVVDRHDPQAANGGVGSACEGDHRQREEGAQNSHHIHSLSNIGPDPLATHSPAVSRSVNASRAERHVAIGTA